MHNTLAEAIDFAMNNRLEDWILEFLRESEGEMPNPNFALADGLLLEERHYFRPICIPLESLRTIRVEHDILDENELKYYLYKVDRIVEKFPDWDMPPLIAQFDGISFILTDGNHRYSALRKMKVASYYTVVWCNKEMMDATWKTMVDRGWVNSGL